MKKLLSMLAVVSLCFVTIFAVAGITDVSAIETWDYQDNFTTFDANVNAQYVNIINAGSWGTFLDNSLAPEKNPDKIAFNATATTNANAHSRRGYAIYKLANTTNVRATIYNYYPQFTKSFGAGGVWRAVTADDADAVTGKVDPSLFGQIYIGSNGIGYSYFTEAQLPGGAGWYTMHLSGQWVPVSMMGLSDPEMTTLRKPLEVEYTTDAVLSATTNWIKVSSVITDSYWDAAANGTIDVCDSTIPAGATNVRVSIDDIYFYGDGTTGWGNPWEPCFMNVKLSGTGASPVQQLPAEVPAGAYYLTSDSAKLAFNTADADGNPSVNAAGRAGIYMTEAGISELLNSIGTKSFNVQFSSAPLKALSISAASLEAYEGEGAFYIKADSLTTEQGTVLGTELTGLVTAGYFTEGTAIESKAIKLNLQKNSADLAALAAPVKISVGLDDVETLFDLDTAKLVVLYEDRVNHMVIVPSVYDGDNLLITFDATGSGNYIVAYAVASLNPPVDESSTDTSSEANSEAESAADSEPSPTTGSDSIGYLYVLAAIALIASSSVLYASKKRSHN